MSTAYSKDISVMEFYLPALTLHLLWSILFIFCLLAPEGMNSIAFGGDKGKRGEVYCLFGRYLCHGILFTRSHIIQLRWSLHYADFFQVSLMIR